MHHSSAYAIRAAVAGALIALAVTPCITQAAESTAAPEATLQPPTRSTAEIFTAIDSAPLGLRPPAANIRERIDLPFGFNYSRDARSLLVPIDEKNEWGVGVNLNLNNSAGVELSPPGLHLAPKRTPGLMLQKKF